MRSLGAEAWPLVETQLRQVSGWRGERGKVCQVVHRLLEDRWRSGANPSEGHERDHSKCVAFQMVVLSFFRWPWHFLVSGVTISIFQKHLPVQDTMGRISEMEKAEKCFRRFYPLNPGGFSLQKKDDLFYGMKEQTRRRRKVIRNEVCSRASPTCQALQWHCMKQ